MRSLKKKTSQLTGPTALVGFAQRRAIQESGAEPWNIGLIKNGRYLQVRFLKWPLNVCFDFFVRNSWITINLDKPSWRNPRFEIHKGCYWICSNISCQLGGKWTLFFSSCSLCTRKNGSSLSAHACGWNSWNILSILFKVPCCCPLRAFFYCPHSICLD